MATFCSAASSLFLKTQEKCQIQFQRHIQHRRIPGCFTFRFKALPQTAPRKPFETAIPSELIIDPPTNLNDTLKVTDSNPSIQTPLQGHPWLQRILEMVPSDRTRGLMLLNLMTFIMSTNPVVVKDAQMMMDPVSFTAVRFVVAALPFIPLLAKMDIDKEVVYAGAELGLWSTLGYLTQGIGLMTTDASRVAFLSALTVILVPIIVGLSGKGVSKLSWCSAAVAMVGVGLLSDAGSGHGASIGDALSLASAVFIAIQIIRTEHYSCVLPSKSRMPLLGISMVSVAIGATMLTCVLHPDIVLHGWQHMNCWKPENCFSWMTHLPLRALLFTGFISTDIVLLIELMALKNVDSTDAAVVYTVEPVLGAMWAYLFLGERWGPNGWIGASLILASSLATQVGGKDDTTTENQ